MRYKEFLDQKPLFYKTIDLQRMPKAYNLIKEQLRLPQLIHIIGTNGKGSTGRFLAGALKEAGYRVGHYTSPHILRFHERIWIDGKEASDEALQSAHERLQQLLPENVSQSLSYFEYTTFLAMLLFEGLDFAVIEAGLGGEYDATAVFDYELSLVTTIDYDHQAFLGERIEDITRTKLNAIKKRGIIGYQIHPEVLEIANSYPITFLAPLDPKLQKVVDQAGLAPFFANNLALALEGAQALGIKVDPQAAVQYRLPGRMERRGNILFDVGHNPLSARAIANTLQKKVVLVYNSYEDKDFRTVLKILAPKVECVEILPIDDERIVDQKVLQSAIKEIGLEFREFEGIQREKEYLVYGSFKVVEEFLRRYERKIL